MNPAIIFEIIELALGVAKTSAVGTGAQGGVDNLLALEKIVQKSLAAYQAESGQPLDLSKLTPEDPIL
jgi:hypothetical protein